MSFLLLQNSIDQAVLKNKCFIIYRATSATTPKIDNIRFTADLLQVPHAKKSMLTRIVNKREFLGQQFRKYGEGPIFYTFLKIIKRGFCLPEIH